MLYFANNVAVVRVGDSLGFVIQIIDDSFHIIMQGMTSAPPCPAGLVLQIQRSKLTHQSGIFGFRLAGMR